MTRLVESPEVHVRVHGSRGPRAVAGIIAFALIAGGIWFGIQWHKSSRQSGAAGAQSIGNEQDALSSRSEGRSVAAQPGKDSSAEQALKRVEKEAADDVAKQANAEAAAQQQAALQQAQQQLAAQAAEQAANEKRLQEERARIDAEKQSAALAAAEDARQRAAIEAERGRQQAAEQAARAAVYQGPSSGEIVWRGEVRGTSLVTIDGDSSDTGQVVSGGLPGVLVMIQPLDAKHVGVAGTPAPSNRFRRLILRVQGNGPVQAVIHWSVP